VPKAAAGTSRNGLLCVLMGQRGGHTPDMNAMVTSRSLNHVLNSRSRVVLSSDCHARGNNVDKLVRAPSWPQAEQVETSRGKPQASAREAPEVRPLLSRSIERSKQRSRPWRHRPREIGSAPGPWVRAYGYLVAASSPSCCFLHYQELEHPSPIHNNKVRIAQQKPTEDLC